MKKSLRCSFEIRSDLITRVEIDDSVDFSQVVIVLVLVLVVIFLGSASTRKCSAEPPLKLLFNIYSFPSLSCCHSHKLLGTKKVFNFFLKSLVSKHSFISLGSLLYNLGAHLSKALKPTSRLLRGSSNL